MENSKIAWTHDTFNPWTGCAKVSPACTHCYAETFNNRFKRAEWGKDGFRHKTGEANWRKPLTMNRKAQRAGERRRIFCASLADVFEHNQNMPLEAWREALHAELIEQTPNLDWLLLTKRPENIAPYYNGRKIPSNVWLGTSVESQKYAEERIPVLLANDCAVRFLSCEPLLGPLDLRPYLGPDKVNWVIVGGESGPGWRVMDPEWARDIRGQCHAAGVPFFFKQYSALHPESLGRELDGQEWSEFPEPLALAY
jgi:protein gp37